jgi:hypothetical protein
MLNFEEGNRKARRIRADMFLQPHWGVNVGWEIRRGLSLSNRAGQFFIWGYGVCYLSSVVEK